MINSEIEERKSGPVENENPLFKINLDELMRTFEQEIIEIIP